MGETVNTVPPRGYKNLQGSDFIKGLSYTAFGIISGIVLFALSQDHWPSWAEWRPVIYTSTSSLIVYIGKNYFTNNEGKMFKQDASTVTVPAKALDEVVEKAEQAEETK